MDIGRPRNQNVIEFSAQLARDCMPTGARHPHKPKGIWAIKPPKRPICRYFDLTGPCQGDMTAAIELGLELAREALDRGDREFAARVLDRIKKIPLEHKRDRLLKTVKRMG